MKGILPTILRLDVLLLLLFLGARLFDERWRTGLARARLLAGLLLCDDFLLRAARAFLMLRLAAALCFAEAMI